MLQVRLTVDVLRSSFAADAAAAEFVPTLGLLGLPVSPLLPVDRYKKLLAARRDDGVGKAAQKLAVGEPELQIVGTLLALNEYGDVFVQVV